MAKTPNDVLDDLSSDMFVPVHRPRLNDLFSRIDDLLIEQSSDPESKFDLAIRSARNGSAKA